jgi:hypothetical protein
MRGKCQAARGNPSPKNGEIGNGRSFDSVKATRGGNDTTYTLRRLARDNPEAKQQDIANEVGTSRQYVHEVLSSKNLDSKELVDIPSHLTATDSKADFRKLPAELREKVAAVSLSIHPKA